jgi:hypothetical protein
MSELQLITHLGVINFPTTFKKKKRSINRKKAQVIDWLNSLTQKSGAMSDFMWKNHLTSYRRRLVSSLMVIPHK